MQIVPKQTTVYEVNGQVFTDIKLAQQYLDELTTKDIKEAVYEDNYNNKMAITLEDFLVLAKKHKFKTLIEQFKKILKEN